MKTETQMTMIRIIPAIDIMSGKCVRLTKGDYATAKSYSDNPVEVARMFMDAGLDSLHIVDLDGARASSPQDLDVLESIASATGLEREWGGGIKDRESLGKVLGSGAARAICGSIAVTDTEEFSGWLQEYGPDRIVLGADARDGKIATHGWLQESDLTVARLVEMYIPYGLQRVICTDIACDGMLQGPSFSLYSALQQQFPKIRFTASGGIGAISDIIALDRMGLDSVIVGKALYEDRISLDEIRRYLKNGSDFS